MLTVETHRGNREASGQESYGRFLYNFYRTYDPQTGRYLKPDPIGQMGGVNLFAYVSSNPIGGIDPFGEQGGPMFPVGNPIFYPVPPNPFAIKENALNEAKALPGYRRAEKDAYRHCLASCEAAVYDQFFAELFGSANEAQATFLGTQHSGDIVMDTYNNAYGRSLADRQCVNCAEACKDALDNHDLLTHLWHKGPKFPLFSVQYK